MRASSKLLFFFFHHLSIYEQSHVSLHSEVSSTKWEFITMTGQEEDLIYRMYRLVGDRWDLIAGRLPGRNADEIERFWIMKHSQVFAEKRNQAKNS
ncbi:hypothetical protein QYF36_020005 [Acer negundo]|nr:hypothetical protein QYF36_020005 [Acer negundo]